MTRWLLPVLLLPLLAAGPPPRSFSLKVPDGGGMALPAPAKPPPVPPTLYRPAPLPNRDLAAPAEARNDGSTTVSPSLFNRRDTYRGEGFSKGSSADAEQDRRVTPGAGFKLKMPFAPN